MKRYIYIEVDTNDGDYVGDMREISIEDEKRFRELAERSGNNLERWQEGDCADTSRYDIYDCFSKEEVDFISGFMPSPEYGFHCCESIAYVTESLAP